MSLERTCVSAMNARELRATGSLAAVFALRLLGLFMIYPVFAVYARALHGATPKMIGLALGAYGLTQGLLQIPLGLLSDRIGRKVVISLGLVLFGFGSAIAAVSTSIEGVLLGRVLQGAGAVGSSILALVADLTREEVRTRAMAVIGLTIGLAFVLAIILGPVLEGVIGVSGIFWLTAVFAVIAIAVTLGVVPAPARILHHRDTEPVPGLIGRALHDGQLLRLDLGIFVLHAILTASFLAVPQVLLDALGVAGNGWLVYLPVLGVSVLLMVPTIIVAEKGEMMKELFLAMITLLTVSLFAFALGSRTSVVVIAALVAFFTAFNVMEAMLPSLITKMAPAAAKGTATGIYSSAQFLGIFAGGAIGGWVYAVGGVAGVFWFGLVLGVIWLAVAATMRRPGHYASYLAHCGNVDRSNLPALVVQLQSAPGVVEAVIVPEEGVAYLKIDPARFDAAAVKRMIPRAAH